MYLHLLVYSVKSIIVTIRNCRTKKSIAPKALGIVNDVPENIVSGPYLLLVIFKHYQNEHQQYKEFRRKQRS